MRLITGMLTALFFCGCGQADQSGTSNVGTSTPGADPEIGAVSSALRIGQRPPTVSGRARRSLRSAADRLSDLQADRIGDNAHNGLDDDDPDDGGWDFTLATTAASHTTVESPENIYGATALGVVAAIRARAGSVRSSTTVLGTGLGAQERVAIDSPNDFVFLPALAELADDPGFGDLARTRYDAKVAAAGGARTLGERDRDQRHASRYDGLVLYDLAWYMLGALSLDTAFPGSGYAADADVYAGIAVNALTGSTPLFDVDDATELFYTQGLAWSLVVLTHAGSQPALLAKVRANLRDGQGADGAWGWNAGTPTDDLQSTAHVVQTLALTVGSDRRGRTEARRGAAWLLSKQAANGGWESSAGVESPLVDGEAMLALYLSQIFPDSGALGTEADGVGQTAQPLTLSGAVTASHPLAAPLGD